MASEDYKDPRWQKKRLEILDLARFKCETCGATDKQLHVHHLVYFPGRKPWDYDKSLLRCLCHSCHKDENDEENASHSIAAHVEGIAQFTTDRIDGVLTSRFDLAFEMVFLAAEKALRLGDESNVSRYLEEMFEFLHAKEMEEFMRAKNTQQQAQTCPKAS